MKYFLLIVVSLILEEACSGQENVDSNCASEVSSLGQMLKESSYIGLYIVTNTPPTLEDYANLRTEEERIGRIFSALDGDTEYGLANLHLSTTLKGQAPKNLTLNSWRNSGRIPSIFFDIKDRHQDLVDHNEMMTGSTALIKDVDEECVAVTHFVKSYQYLIFGNVQSTAAREPILSISYDPLYKAVLNLMK
jgi:hypothetical protein